MTLNNNLAVLIEHQRQLFAFIQKTNKPSWQSIPFRGEASISAEKDDCWQKALDDVTDFINQDNDLADYSVFVISDQSKLLTDKVLISALETSKAEQCQLLTLTWLAEHTGTHIPTEADIKWLQQFILPELTSVKETTFKSNDAQEKDISVELQKAKTHIKRLQQKVEQLQKAEKQLTQQLQEKAQTLQDAQADINTLKRRGDALINNELTMDDLASLLPGLYKNLWCSISPSDLALLAGTTVIPQITSPVHEPTDAVIQTLKKRILALHRSQKEQLRELCRQLPRQFTIRPEMQFFFEDEACV